METKKNSWNLLVIPLLAAIIFAALAPALTWPQVTADSETWVVQSILEMRRGGPWWIPTLDGNPRVRKPPLTQWISAAAVKPSTMSALTSRDPAVREPGYQSLAWEIRWPVLFQASLLLVAVGWLGQLLDGLPTGIFAVLIGGSSMLFDRFSRLAAPDVPLAMSVAWANLFLGLAIVGKRPRLGYIGAGAALGIALMSKGPVAFLFTIIPFAIFQTIFGAIFRESLFPGEEKPQRVWPAILIGIAVMLAIGLPWPISALIRNSQSLHDWYLEMSSEGGKAVSHDPWFTYLIQWPYALLPWIPLLIAAVMMVGQRPKVPKVILLALLVVIPTILLSFAKDRKDRYLFPMIGPAAIAMGMVVAEFVRIPPTDRDRRRREIMWFFQWAFLAAMGIGLPIAGLFLKRVDGTRWFPWPVGVGAVIGMAILVWIGIQWQKHWDGSAVVVGSAIMLLFNLLFLWGWRNTDIGLSGMKPLADRIRYDLPRGEVVYYEPKPIPKPTNFDLEIYLDQLVPVLRSEDELRQHAGAVAVVMLHRTGEPPPQAPGYKPLMDVNRRDHNWWVLVPDAGATR
jgi:4-amino-4-deoxy-L-arabinose transferase-like glycosyltransferase